jgi:putative transferase (TIGR04331 family)
VESIIAHNIIAAAEIAESLGHPLESVAVASLPWSSSSDYNSWLTRADQYHAVFHKNIIQKLLQHFPKTTSFFWNKLLFLFSPALISTTFEMYTMLLSNFSPEKYQYSILSKKNIYPLSNKLSFHCMILDSTMLSDILFSLYIDTFCRNEKTTNILYDAKINNYVTQPDGSQQHSYHSVFGNILRRINTVYLLTQQGEFRKILNKIKYNAYKKRKKKMMLYGIEYSQESLEQLFLRTHGRIDSEFDIVPYTEQNTPANFALRDELFAPLPNLGQYGIYLSQCLKILFPKTFLEEIDSSIAHYLAQYNKVSFSYVVNENWISHEDSVALSMATLELSGITHVSMRHAAIPEHCFLRNNYDRVGEACTLHIDFHTNDGTNTIGLGTLNDIRPSTIPLEHYDIAYIATPYIPHLDSFVTSSGYAGSYAMDRRINTEKRFFSNLSDFLLHRITIKEFPRAVGKTNMTNVNRRFFFSEYYQRTGKVLDTGKLDAIGIMRNANLVIIPYIGLPFYEALFCSVPFVALWDPELEKLHPDYSIFFQPLLEAGICFADPAVAAHSLESIATDIDRWWLSNVVQSAKKEFMMQYTADRDKLYQFLSELASGLSISTLFSLYSNKTY